MVGISPIIRYYALSIGLIVLCTLLLELWSILVDLSSTLPTQSNAYCFIQNYLRFISFIILESTLFIFWVIRLRHTFTGSVLSLPNKFIYFMFICIPCLTLLLLIICGVSIVPRYFQINVSFNSSMNNIGYGCTVINNAGIFVFFMAAQCISIIFNIFFGYFFYHKLKKFVEIVCNQSSKHHHSSYQSPDSTQRQSAISVLMQKHTLLALITVVSAIVSYVTFDILLYIFYDGFVWQFAFLFIDIDMVIKTSTCFLMFKFYENKFFKLCFCCIKIAAMPNKCKCCNKHTAISHITIFDELAQKAKDVAVLQSNGNGDEKGNIDDKRQSLYNDEYGEDRMIFTASKSSGIKITSGVTAPKLTNLSTTNNKNNNKNNNNKKIIITVSKESEEYILGEYTFHILLVKAKLFENNVMHRRIFQYAMRGQKIDDEDGMFSRIDKQYKPYGQFMDNKCNVFYYKNNQCQFPFIVAVKLETESIKDGNIISKYVSKRIHDTLNKLSDIKGFKYEPLLEQIIKEIKSKHIDLNGILPLNKSLSNDSNHKRSILSKKSKQKIIPLPKLDVTGVHRSLPSQSNDGNHTPIKAYSPATPNESKGYNKVPSNVNKIQTANHIQMS